MPPPLKRAGNPPTVSCPTRVLVECASTESGQRLWPGRVVEAAIVETTNMAKSKRSAEDQRLTQVSKICLRLPEATRQNFGSHASFLVRKKTFAYFLNDHHGDKIVSVACKALPGDNSALVVSQPGRFYLPSYIGPRGWVALRLDIGEPDWKEVSELITGSYLLIAPKRLTLSIAREN